MRTGHRSKALRRRNVAAAAGVLAALVAAMHAPFARPLWMRLGGCPLGRVSPAEVEAAQRGALAAVRGATPAPSCPALGFELGRTTLDDVERWARDHRVEFTTGRGDTFMRCDRVPGDAIEPAAAAAVDEIAFGFEVASPHRLVNLTTLRTGCTCDAAARQVQDIVRWLDRRLDPAVAAPRLLPGAAWDAAAPAVVHYHYSDYIAEVGAMRLPRGGVAVREQYALVALPH